MCAACGRASAHLGVPQACSALPRPRLQRGAQTKQSPGCWRRSLTPRSLLRWASPSASSVRTPRAARTRVCRGPRASFHHPPPRLPSPAGALSHGGCERSRAWENPWAGGRHNKPFAPAPRRLSAGREAACPASALLARPPARAHGHGPPPPLAGAMLLAGLPRFEASQMPGAGLGDARGAPAVGARPRVPLRALGFAPWVPRHPSR